MGALGAGAAGAGGTNAVGVGKLDSYGAAVSLDTVALSAGTPGALSVGTTGAGTGIGVFEVNWSI